ncbi:MAG: competence/damage-inducible protein A [Marinilabiliales bacterium]|nr:MAG: competence/damage-inducible protein A [Marinilabiliales bacterium]
MEAALITIGEELLIGQVIDTNSAWLGQRLNELGIKVMKRVSVPDNPDLIAQAYNLCMSNYDIIISTGGLGPTSDDNTKEMLCKLYDSKLIEDRETVEHIKRFFADRGLGLSEVNRRQGWVPDKATIMHNELGTAPGLYFHEGKTHVFALPGVPFEMKNLFENKVTTHLKMYLAKGTIIHETMTVSGIGESFLSDKIKEWEENIPDDISLAYLPSPGLIRLRLSMSTSNEESGRTQLRTLFLELRPQVEEFYMSDRDERAHETLFRTLKELNKTVSTAESCTGGTLASLITSIPGSSNIFKGSVVAYENSIKQNVLKVNATDLENHGAVSREVVEQMATNVRKLMNTDYAIATSGIAGPDGGTDEKPVGFTWIAIAWEGGVQAKLFKFGKLREVNIARSCVHGIHMLIKQIRNS